MTIEALNCPNCGGGVASDRTQCEFCKTRLKTMACPSCFGLIFIGSKFCGHCGAIAAPITLTDLDETGDCPRCRISLEGQEIETTNLRRCNKCDGLWMDTATFESICLDIERQSAVLTFLASGTTAPQRLTKVNYVPCPDCGQLMNRNNFAKASGVIVDICKKDGVWFDADELTAIVDFVRKGGMEIAREKEKNELKNERDKLRDEQRQMAAPDHAFGSSGVFSRSDSIGISSFVRRLFD